MAKALSQAQSDEFDGRGVLRFDQFFPIAAIDVMRERLWEDIERRYRMQRDVRESWSTPMPAQFQSLIRSGAFAPMETPALVALADAFLGTSQWYKPQHWGKPLVTFPTPDPVLARPPWHLDLGAHEKLRPLSTMRLFTFLDHVLPGGGGTLYIAGSHRFALEEEQRALGTLRSADVKGGLRKHRWFDELFAARTAEVSPLINVEAAVGGNIVTVEEMTGRPGDLILMHPGVIHAIGHNRLSRPRLMLTETLRRRPME
ncbi:phytanoyl-CoA dioxygenase family protein [Phenylobacterium sp.]|uniref:phytanoyl-CoA dioxygenase family protein n=1 Tax=Phenylobacterium sp. TaxID=1871053 RepID=UPI002FDA41B3